jgi:hypothetical protein
MGSGLISIRIQQKTSWNNGFTLRDYYTADYIGDSDTPDSYTDTLTETTTGDYSYSLNGWDKHHDTNENLYWSDSTNVSQNESFQSHVVHVNSLEEGVYSESVSGTQSGHGDSAKYMSSDHYYEINDSYSFTAEDHYSFTGTLNGTEATITNTIHGSLYSTYNSYHDSDSYSATIDSPGFGSGATENNFTGVSAGAAFSDRYWTVDFPSGSNYNSQNRASGGSFSSTELRSTAASGGGQNVQATEEQNRWAHRPGDGTFIAGSYLDPNFDPMGHRQSLAYAGSFNGNQINASDPKGILKEKDAILKEELDRLIAAHEFLYMKMFAEVTNGVNTNLNDMILKYKAWANAGGYRSDDLKKQPQWFQDLVNDLENDKLFLMKSAGIWGVEYFGSFGPVNKWMGFDTGAGDSWLMMEMYRTATLIETMKKMRDNLK